MPGVCKHNIFNDDIIYIVSNNGYTAQYDFNKNKWIKIYDIDGKINDNLNFDGAPFVWMDNDPNILYCAFNSFIGYLDLRQNYKKWIKISEIKQPISGNSTLFL